MAEIVRIGANRAKKNPYRISIREWMEREGIASREELYESDVLSDSVVTALCEESCDVEPDGRCPHNCPSPLLVLGLI